MTRLSTDNKQKEACDILGIHYDYLMHLKRTGMLDGTFYCIGRRIFFVKEKLEIWQENQIRQSASSEENCFRIAR